MGATTGIVGATVVTLGLLTLPGCCGAATTRASPAASICASGTLGQIIPPSLILILLADILQLSVGTLFAAAVIPGLLLAGDLLRLHPDPRHRAAGHGAADPAGGARRWSRGASCWMQLLQGGGAAGRAWSARCSARSSPASPRRPKPPRWARSARSWSPPSPAGCRWKVLRETVQATTKITAMMMFILICAQVFALAFRGLQGEELVHDLFAFLPGGVNADIWFLMLIIFVLGFFIEWIEISYIAVPLFLPVFVAARTSTWSGWRC